MRIFLNIFLNRLHHLIHLHQHKQQESSESDSAILPISYLSNSDFKLAKPV